MILTEEDARQKICHKLRDLEQEDMCIASDCMAWRWARGSADVGGIKRPNPEDSRPMGYCGLAGRPE